MDLKTTFEQFIQAGLYLRGWSERTPTIYRRALTGFQASVTPFTQTGLEAWIVRERQRGLSPSCCNIYIRAMNAFASWLLESGHTTDKIKLRQIKTHRKPVKVLSPDEIRRLLRSQPKRLSHLRTWILIVLLLDTGCRIDELLSVQRSDIDFDNLLLTVRGKGNKVRRIPFSPDARKHLWSFLQRWEKRHGKQRFVFCTRHGVQLTYRNTYRDVKACFAKAGVTGTHVHPHNLRHTFSCCYIRRGGNVVVLSRLLGHSSITTTQTYLRGLQIEDFGTAHAHLSPLTF